MVVSSINIMSRDRKHHQNAIKLARYSKFTIVLADIWHSPPTYVRSKCVNVSIYSSRVLMSVCNLLRSLEYFDSYQSLMVFSAKVLCYTNLNPASLQWISLSREFMLQFETQYAWVQWITRYTSMTMRCGLCDTCATHYVIKEPRPYTLIFLQDKIWGKRPWYKATYVYTLEMV